MKNNHPRRILIIIFLFVATKEYYIQCPGIRIIMLLDCRVGNTVGRGDCYEFATSQTFEISCGRNWSVGGTGLEKPVMEILSRRAGLQEPVCWRNRRNRSVEPVSRNRSQGTGLEEPVLEILPRRAGLQEPVCWRNRSGEPVWKNRSVRLRTGLEEPVCCRNRSRGTGLEEPISRNRSRGTGLGNLASKSRSTGTGLLAEPV